MIIGEIVLVVLGGLLLLVAAVGAVVPVIPGPLLAVGSLLLVSWAGDWSIYSWPVLIVWAVVALGSQVLDNILPARAAGKAGANRYGVLGSVVGMIVGTIALPPFGVFIGAFAGALLGEVFFHKENEEPLKAALAVFRGTLGAIAMKLGVVGAIAFVFVRGVLRLF